MYMYVSVEDEYNLHVKQVVLAQQEEAEPRRLA